jgi:D-3-phosphoglycerate dehydrogenase
MAQRSIAITTSNFDMSNPLLDGFRDAGWKIARSGYGRKLTETEAAALLSDCGAVGMVAGVEPLTERVFESNPQLRVISRCGTGFDSVDVLAAQRRGIRTLNTPDAPAAAVAEHTLGLMLAVLRSIAHVDRELRTGRWQARMGSLLAQRAVGVVGLGRIGSRVADLCSAFGARVKYCDPTIATAEYPRLPSVEALAAEVDMLTVHVPLTEDTHNLVGAAVLEKLPRHSVLINTARGGIVDEEAVTEALEAGRLDGAAFDVFCAEPYTGALRTFDNVVVTAHMGSYAREARSLMESEALTNLRAALQVIDKW